MSLITGCTEVENENEFYSKADDYWKSIPANINGMLGGYGHISNVDIRSSKLFLKPFLEGRTKTNKAVDCGAGIGRVTKHLLLPLFKSVDLVELNKDFLEKAKTYLGDSASRVGNYICCSLKDIEFKDKSCDVIWIQWVTGHLTDAHFVRFLERCKAALTDGGIIIVKDNVAIMNVEHDPLDSSVTRNYEDFAAIYKAAGLKVLREQKQRNFPTELYNVVMTALES